MKNIFVFIFIFVVAQVSRAETPITHSTPAPAPASSGSSGVNKTAKQTSSSANIMMMADMAAGAAMLVACQAPPKPMLCVIGGATLAMAGILGGGAGNADGVAQATEAVPGSGYVPGGGPAATPPSKGFDPGTAGQYAELKQKYADAGYVISADGQSMTLPSGQTVSMAALSAGKVPGYELTPEIQATANKIGEEAMKQVSGAHIVAVGTEGGGGSQQALAPSDSAQAKFDMSKYLKGLSKRDPSSVSGLSKKLGEDSIGIKSDNIFEMITRQYKRKQSQNSFIN